MIEFTQQQMEDLAPLIDSIGNSLNHKSMIEVMFVLSYLLNTVLRAAPKHEHQHIVHLFLEWATADTPHVVHIGSSPSYPNTVN